MPVQAASMQPPVGQPMPTQAATTQPPVGQPMPAPAYAPPAPAQAQAGTATITFLAKKVMGQFLVSSATLEVNGVPYQASFKQPIVVQAPAGNVQLVGYLNYMGRSGVAQALVALAPGQSYQVEYKSPAVVTGSGTLTVTQG
jgi:3-oxoacyl-ACP reductase-like protein